MKMAGRTEMKVYIVYRIVNYEGSIGPYRAFRSAENAEAAAKEMRLELGVADRVVIRTVTIEDLEDTREHEDDEDERLEQARREEVLTNIAQAVEELKGM
jgi:hypothetical protein